MTIRACKSCGGWHDLDEPWPAACMGHNAERGGGVQIIRDIEPYKTVAADVNGKPARIGGRRQHREFLQRNNYVEVGNDTPKSRAPEVRGDFASGADVKRAMEQLNRRNP